MACAQWPRCDVTGAKRTVRRAKGSSSRSERLALSSLQQLSPRTREILNSLVIQFSNSEKILTRAGNSADHLERVLKIRGAHHQLRVESGLELALFGEESNSVLEH